MIGEKNNSCVNNNVILLNTALRMSTDVFGSEYQIGRRDNSTINFASAAVRCLAGLSNHWFITVRKMAMIYL